MNNLKKDNNENHNILSCNNKTGTASKKRKLSADEISSSSIKIEVLQFANEKLEQYVKKLETEKFQYYDGCSAEKILELENTVSKLQSINAELNANNEVEKVQHQAEMNEFTAKIEALENEKLQQNNSCNEQKILELEDTVKKLQAINSKIEEEKNQHKNEMDSVKNEYETKIKIFEAEKKEFESKIQELADEISSMKTIKIEIKDSVENERETCHSETIKFKAEINELKKRNQNLRICHQKEIENLKDEKEAAEKLLKNLKENLQSSQKMKDERKKSFQSFSIDSLKMDNNRKTDEPVNAVSLDKIFNGTKPDIPSLSCITITNITKIIAIREGWQLYSTNINQSKAPYLLIEDEMLKTFFKLNINGLLFVDGSGPKINQIMPKINICEITKLHLGNQEMNFDDYLKLVSSKKVEICILESMNIFKDRNTQCNVKELLCHLPNIKVFKFKISTIFKHHSVIAKNLGQLDPFSNLQHFEISNLSESFILKDLDEFIKKQNKNVTYFFKFYGKIICEKRIQETKMELLKSLSFPCNILVEFE